MAPEKHSVDRRYGHDDCDEACHDPGGSLVHYVSNRESHIIGGIGMALGLPPEQPSGDGAKELARRAFGRIGPARERPIDGANDEVVTQSE